MAATARGSLVAGGQGGNAAVRNVEDDVFQSLGLGRWKVLETGGRGAAPK